MFDEEGNESKQIDIIVTTDTSPRFSFPNNSGKSFSPVEGCLGVVSVKSKLDKAQLYDALGGIASIPLTKPLDGRVSFEIEIKEYENWPSKIIYASDGLKAETILEHLNQYYVTNNHIPISRRPDVIHVIGKYAILKVNEGMELKSTNSDEVRRVKHDEAGTYILIKENSDLHAIIITLDDLQQNASSASNIHFSYSWIIKSIHN